LACGEIKLISLGAQSKHKKEDCVIALEKIRVKLLSSSYLEEAKSISCRIEVLRASPRVLHILFPKIWCLPTPNLVWGEKKKSPPRVSYISIPKVFSWYFFLRPSLMFYIRNPEFVSIRVKAQVWFW
jgi:hypothetical protein